MGRCLYCNAPYDSFDPHCVCTVCREPTLVCQECQKQLFAFHCRRHFHLRFCYFSDLERFSADDLKAQLRGLKAALEHISIGRRFRQKRKTLQKQCERIEQRLMEIESAGDIGDVSIGQSKCRNCGDEECSGRCWGRRKFCSPRRCCTRWGQRLAVHCCCTSCPTSDDGIIGYGFWKSWSRAHHTTGCHQYRPVVWWARREIHLAEESCCDSWVVSVLPSSRQANASA